MFLRGLSISVPPKSAFILSINSIAFYTLFSSYLRLSGNINSKLEPKLIILKNESIGNDLINVLKAFFAWVILVPSIEPLLSITKINSPLTVSKSIRKFPFSFDLN